MDITPTRFRPYFHWEEPEVFVKLRKEFERKLDRWWHTLALYALAGVGLLRPWYVKSAEEKNHLPMAWEIIAVSVMVLLILLILHGLLSALKWLFLKFGLADRVSRIEVLNSMLIRNHTKVFRFSTFASFSWLTQENFSTLVLVRKKDARPIFIGAPKDVAHEAVSAFLRERGVEEEAVLPSDVVSALAGESGFS